MTSHHEIRHTKPRMPKGLKKILAGAVLLAVIVASAGLISRARSKTELAQWTTEQAVPTVSVILPKTDDKSLELTLPGDLEAYFEAPIYARVNGYLKSWDADIGAHVKAGQLLAEIDTPELDQQLQKAENDLIAAKANEDLAEITAKRWQALLASDAVSRQEADEKAGDAAAKKAIADAANANVSQLKALESFKRIVAPFDGVVTARKTDVGALINSGSGSGPELFSVADVHKLRIYVHVPQNLSGDLHPGLKAHLSIPQFPDKSFAATLVTTAEAISQASRTMLVELQTENSKGLLTPGTYAEVTFELPPRPDVLRLPASTVLFRAEGLSVASVGADDKVAIKPITIGRDLGNAIEVVAGIGPGDRIIDNPPDSISQGEPVHVKTDAGAGR